MRMARKFKWDMWDYDCNGLAYIIAKDECPNKSDVPQYIVEEDGGLSLRRYCARRMVQIYGTF
jgi:hypothetical protein